MDVKRYLDGTLDRASGTVNLEWRCTDQFEQQMDLNVRSEVPRTARNETQTSLSELRALRHNNVGKWYELFNCVDSYAYPLHPLDRASQSRRAYILV